MSDRLDIAVVGATGAVGESMLEILRSRKFPVGTVYALASERSVGKTVAFGNKQLTVEDLADFDFSKVALGLFSAGGSVSAEFAPKAAAAGCVVIDNTSHFRRDDDIPLVVPEVNADAIAGYKARGIIANPNCSTIQMLVALKPIYDAVGIERINVCTYQAVSGAGRSAIEELVRQTANLLNGRPLEIEGDVKQIGFNAIPHIDVFMDNRYTREEMKMVWETRKILGDDEILVNPTAVRIPVFYGHSEAVHIETRDKISAQSVVELLTKSPGIKVLDGVETG
ncbi:MAG: aspartate-semialdehyde dehydrogenase, partial [Gammaproteobacteria bacterium]|nr:aspartate-semialdehyde dehydrogenase [Gammaproteobacteria bacterium]